MRVLIAPDSFKGTLTAQSAAQRIAAGWRLARPGDELLLLPLADGGEGTLDVVAAALPGAVSVPVGACTGPDGRPVEGRYLRLDADTALVECAVTTGLPLMDRSPAGRPGPDAAAATSHGVGEVIARALADGARRIAVALGGSACTDGGAGALAALGLGLYDEAGRPLPDGGGALARLHRIDRSRLAAPPQLGSLVLVDVTNPLCGPQGAAAVFGPQKGATAQEVQLLDAALRHWSALFGGDPGQPGAGAAGGLAYGLVTAWGAQTASGARYVCELVGLDAAVRDADLVVTGEGRFDATSAAGKLVSEVMRVAGRHGVPAAIVAGSAEGPAPSGVRALSTAVDAAGGDEAALAEPERWVAAAARALAARL